MGSLDGLYGPRTASAVTAYQKANNLTVDAIAGPNTLGSLYAPKLPAATAPVATQTATPMASGIGDNAPGHHDDSNGATYSAVLPNANYDYTTDPLYLPLKQQYESQGMTAFNNVIGRLSALTGGRPSTAAVGTATGGYNKYLQEFSANVLPSLISQGQKRLDSQREEVRNSFLDTMGQYYDNYQAQINKLATDNDTSNDWQIPYLRSARQEKIQGMESAQASAERQAYEDDIATQERELERKYKMGMLSVAQYNAETARLNNLKGSGDEYDYKTDPDFADEMQGILQNPDAALGEVKANASALINKYGYSGFKELLKTAAPDKSDSWIEQLANSISAGLK